MLADRVTALQKRIFDEKYYETLWCQALTENLMSTATIDQHEHSPNQLISLLNTFWDLLPDSPVIRTPLFFELCNLCTEDQDS